MLKKIILVIIAAVLAFLIAIFAWYFTVGSLEMFAIPEKISQVRESCCATILVLSVMEAGVAVGLFKEFKK